MSDFHAWYNGISCNFHFFLWTRSGLVARNKNKCAYICLYIWVWYFYCNDFSSYSLEKCHYAQDCCCWILYHMVLDGWDLQSDSEITLWMNGTCLLLFNGTMLFIALYLGNCHFHGENIYNLRSYYLQRVMLKLWYLLVAILYLF